MILKRGLTSSSAQIGPLFKAALPGLTTLLFASTLSVAVAGAQPTAPEPEAAATPAILGIERQIGAPAGAARSGEALEVAVEELSRELRCPVCQGMAVADSPSSSALAMRAEIADLLAAGYSPDQVTEYFVNTYGEFVLLDPRPEGLNWVLWLAPVLAFVGGLVWVAARSRRRPPAPANEDAEELDDYLVRVRAEVAATRPPAEGDTEDRTQPAR